MKNEEKVIQKNQSCNKELYKKYSIVSIILGIVSIVLVSFFHISILCGIMAIGFGASSVKKGKKILSIIGIVLGIIGMILTTIIAINFLAFVIGGSGNLISDLIKILRKFQA